MDNLYSLIIFTENENDSICLIFENLEELYKYSRIPVNQGYKIMISSNDDKK